MRDRCWILMVLAILGAPAAGLSQTPQTQPAEQATEEKAENSDRLQVYDEIQVTDRASDMLGVADSATEGVTGHKDLEKRPILRPGELLETVPGVIITQHSGDGKANQYFLRGFNLDHGTDFRITVDDVPVNLPTHGHGQGYSDLNFLIPELVDTVRYKKGPYYADEGDFSAAGAANLTYVTSLPKGIVQATPGSYGYGRLLVADSTKVRDGDLLGALEYGRNDGPWDLEEGFRKFNGLLRWNRGDTANGFTLTAMGYDGEWNSTDQIPQRAVSEGLIGRYGFIDPSDGGQSHRFSLSAEMRRGSGSTLTRASAYVLRYGLELFSNFTYFLDDPVNADQFEQKDDRTVAGFKVERQWLSDWGGREIETSLGLQARGDDIANGLFHTSERVRLETTRTDDVAEVLAGPYAQTRVHWNSWLRTVAGLRADYLHTKVESNLEENSGTRDDTILSPKLSILLGPWKETEVYLNAGYGFHSNDARGATIRVDPRTGEPLQRVDPLVRAQGADIGVRTTLVPNLQFSVTAFALDLDSELVFVGDAGGTEASRPSRRTGVEIQSFYRPLPWLSLDADLALSRGCFKDSDPVGDRIPGSIQQALSAGISADGLGSFKNVFGSLRVRYFGPRPLIEDDSIRSDSSTLVNTELGYRFANGLSVALEVFNLLDETVSDIDYFYESRLAGEAEAVEDVHFHPTEKRSARLVIDWRF
jgi:hypothetical protein